MEKYRHMTDFDPRNPHNTLPLLPPSRDIETKPILRKCIAARSALAELKIAGDLIPNQTVLINTIPLLEAKDSSEIENIVTTTDSLFRFAFDHSQAIDPATKEALRYRQALFEGYKSLRTRPFSTATAVEICSVIKNAQMNIRQITGTALANDKTGHVIYTPPVGEDLIRNKLSNWEKFMHEETDVDPLIRMAVGHYQFEAIHPFTDGNGRTGRILNLLFLIEQDLLKQPILYLSRYILKNKTEYYRLLLQVTREQDWESWLLYMLDAVLETAQWTSLKVKSIRDLIENTASFVRTKQSKIYTRELVDTIFTQPYCRINNLVKQGLAQRETASNHLKKLCEIGVLREYKDGREKIFINDKFLKLLFNEDHQFELY